MRSWILLAMLAPAVQNVDVQPAWEDRSLKKALPVGFCFAKCLLKTGLNKASAVAGGNQQRRRRLWPAATAAVSQSSEDVARFASLRKLVILMKQRGQCEAKKSKRISKVNEQFDAVSTVLHGLRLGSSLRYRYSHPYSAQAALPGSALQLVVSKLQATALSVIMDPQARRHLDFTTDEIARVRNEVSHQHAVGEKHLTLLSQLFANRFTEGKYSCTSIVTAQADQYSFTLSQTVPHSALRGGADSLRIAAQQLHEVRVDVSDGGRSKAVADNKMLDHSIEFEAHRWNEWGVHRVVAHARSSKDLWRLIADSLFAVEGLPDLYDPSNHADAVSMYKIQIVVDDVHHAQAMHRSLRNFCWHDTELREHGVPVTAHTRRMELLEQEVLPCAAVHANGHGHTGGEVRLTTFRWLDTAVCVQVQTLCEHYEEAELASLCCRRQAEERVERLHRQLAQQTPLFGFSRELLQWIVDAAAAGAPPPSCESIHVEVRD